MCVHMGVYIYTRTVPPNSYISTPKQCSCSGSKGQIHGIGLFLIMGFLPLSKNPITPIGSPVGQMHTHTHKQMTAMVKVRAVVVIFLPARGRQESFTNALLQSSPQALFHKTFCCVGVCSHKQTHTSVFHSSL